MAFLPPDPTHASIIGNSLAALDELWLVVAIQSAPTLLVLADDLTGANDAGVQFAAQGVRSIVLVDHQVVALPADYPVVVLNTASRHISPARAAERVRESVRLGARAGTRFFYKKTDSTLRGNIGAELEALLAATHSPFVPFVPALPELGRTTRNGIHYLQGVPLAETAFARDPLNPVRKSRVSDVLQETTRVLSCNLEAGEQPETSFRGIAVLDCNSAGDLVKIAHTFAGEPGCRIFSGSVALARHLIAPLGIQSPLVEEPDPLLPILLINGSLNELALAQIRESAPLFAKLQLLPSQLIGGRADLTIPPGGGNLLLYSILEPAELQAFRDQAHHHGLSPKVMHLRVAERTGRIVQQILASDVYRTLIVFGGDTLAGIARACHWRSLAPRSELEPGLSVTVPTGTPLTLISKAGGFGDVHIVNRIVQYVSKNTQK